MPADVNLGIDIEKKGSGDKEAAAGLELVAHAADNAKDELAQLDRKLIETRAALLAAGKDFAKTGDISPFKSLLKDERQLQQVSKTLGRLTKDFEVAGQQSGQSFVARFGNIVSSGLPGIGGLSSGMTTALVAGAVAAGPIITSGLAAAVLLGVGGATLAGGIVAAAHDSRVRSAWADVGLTASQGLQQASSVFVDPLVNAAGKIKAEFSTDLVPTLRGSFETLAPTIGRLTDGVIGLVHNALPGFNALIQASAPVINQLADDLPRLGTGISFFASQVAQAGGGAKDFIADLVTLANATLTTTGLVINLGSKLEQLSHVPGFGGLLQDMSELESKSGGVQKQFTLLKPAADGASQSIYGTGNAVQALNQKLSDLLGQALSVKQAELGMAQALTGVADSAKQQGTSLDFAKAAGQANASALLAGAEAAGRHRQALLAAGASADFATAAYNRDVDSLYKAAAAAGFNSGQVNGLIGNLRAIPRDTPANVTVTGVDSAIERVLSLSRAINSLHDRVVTTTLVQNTVTGETRVSVNPGLRMNRFGGLYEHADIGKLRDALVASPMSPARYAYAEPSTGGEAFIPKYGSYGRSMSILSKAASWYGAAVVPGGGGAAITLIIDSGGSSLDDFVLEALRRSVKVRGGNVQIIVAGKPAA